jgi:periplasmic divalent cation tolerance protein
MTISAILVLTGTSSREEAQAIVDAAITQRLAAAAQVIGPVTSTYRWEGALTQADEWLCLLKTTTLLYETLEQTIRTIHSYTLPSILAIPVVAGSTAYLTWLAQEVRQDKD